MPEYEDYRALFPESEYPGLKAPELVHAVISRKFGWALRQGVPDEELFQEGVIALLNAPNYPSFPAPERRVLSHYWMAVEWGLLRYLHHGEGKEAAYRYHEIPFSEAIAMILPEGIEADEQEDYLASLGEPLSDSWREPESELELTELIDEIMRVARTHADTLRWARGNEGQKKLRKTLSWLATGYNYTEVADKIWGVSRERVRQYFGQLRAYLVADTWFMLKYGEEVRDRRGTPRARRDSRAILEQEGQTAARISPPREKRRTLRPRILMPAAEELLAGIERSTVPEMAAAYGIDAQTMRNWLRAIGAGRVCQKCGETFTGPRATTRYTGHMASHRFRERHPQRATSSTTREQRIAPLSEAEPIWEVALQAFEGERLLLLLEREGANGDKVLLRSVKQRMVLLEEREHFLIKEVLERVGALQPA
ncbi:MAG: hypothetical protein HYT49_03670 [Candidatus Wildermuthbacteria bacterium]|nr:hypothetical protein [Candidatus Wildermuthbacteria bacterium]